ncbi:hypothetical protein MHYP_G00241940 [Metynnis hypsauchen]
MKQTESAHVTPDLVPVRSNQRGLKGLNVKNDERVVLMKSLFCTATASPFSRKARTAPAPEPYPWQLPRRASSSSLVGRKLSVTVEVVPPPSCVPGTSASFAGSQTRIHNYYESRLSKSQGYTRHGREPRHGTLPVSLSLLQKVGVCVAVSEKTAGTSSPQKDEKSERNQEERPTLPTFFKRSLFRSKGTELPYGWNRF